MKLLIKLPFLSIPPFSLSGISRWVDQTTHLEIPDREKGGIERKGNFINNFIVPWDLWLEFQIFIDIWMDISDIELELIIFIRNKIIIHVYI